MTTSECGLDTFQNPSICLLSCFVSARLPSPPATLPSLEFNVPARAAVADMTLTAALIAALFSFLRKRYMMAYIACGIAFFAKDPIGFGQHHPVGTPTAGFFLKF